MASPNPRPRSSARLWLHPSPRPSLRRSPLFDFILTLYKMQRRFRTTLDAYPTEILVTEALWFDINTILLHSDFIRRNIHPFWKQEVDYVTIPVRTLSRSYPLCPHRSIP